MKYGMAMFSTIERPPNAACMYESKLPGEIASVAEVIDICLAACLAL